MVPLGIGHLKEQLSADASKRFEEEGKECERVSLCLLARLVGSATKTCQNLLSLGRQHIHQVMCVCWIVHLCLT